MADGLQCLTHHVVLSWCLQTVPDIDVKSCPVTRFWCLLYWWPWFHGSWDSLVPPLHKIGPCPNLQGFAYQVVEVNLFSLELLQLYLVFSLFHFPEWQFTPPGLVDLRSGFSTWSGCRQIFRFGAFFISSLNCYLSTTFASAPMPGSTSTFAPFLEILQLFFLALGCAVRCTSMCCIIRAISLLI